MQGMNKYGVNHVFILGLFIVVVGCLLGAAPVEGQTKVRLNRMIELWEQGMPVFGAFARFRDPDGAIYYSTSDLDFVIFDMEHGAADFNQFRIFLQFMMDRGRLLQKGNLQPSVVPLARIPTNGIERTQWLVKQVLDVGAYGLMAPHIASVEEARAIVAASRYPQKVGSADLEPRGERGVAYGAAAKYWGVPGSEYFELADLWPLDPKGEIALIILLEDTEGVKNARQILTEVKGIAAVFIGPFDLSTSLGYPGQIDHPEVEKAIQSVLAVTKELNIPCGILANRDSLEKRVKEGFKFLVLAGSPGDIEEGVRMGRRLSGREK